VKGVSAEAASLVRLLLLSERISIKRKTSLLREIEGWFRKCSSA